MIDEQNIRTARNDVLMTMGVSCLAGILGAYQGAYAGAFYAAVSKISFTDGIKTGGKWGAMLWAGGAMAIGLYMAAKNLHGGRQ